MLLNSVNFKRNATYEERIVQFGEGNFLRAFADWMVQEMNDKAGFNGAVVVVQPIENGLVDKLNSQDGLYHVVCKGIKDSVPSKEITLNAAISRGINPYTHFSEYIKLVEQPGLRFVISNTTEAGIVFNPADSLEMQPPVSFPAKLTQLLYRRFQYFKGDHAKGFIVLPCELIENNAIELKSCILKYCELWKLPSEFIDWLNAANTFCNTLVDRIVPGFSDETSRELSANMNVEDSLCVDAEQFHLWVIEGPASIENEFPTTKARLNVVYTKDVKPYRTRKVRLLNGSHTLMTPVAYLSGIDFVRDAVEHPVIGKYIQDTITKEIIPTINLPINELNNFANEVINRFRNPFVNHALMSISLNSISKFKARLVPTLKDFVLIENKLPENIVFSLAALILFYKGDRNGQAIHLQDDAAVLEFFNQTWAEMGNTHINLNALVFKTLSNTEFWGQDLTAIDSLVTKTTDYLNNIVSFGMLRAIEGLLEKSR